MLFALPDDEVLYAALLARDAVWDGRAYVGVTSTGVFCRLTCPARKPKRENCRFHETVAACLEAGFRPCKRCYPLNGGAEPCIAPLVEALEADPNRRWGEEDVVVRGFDPSTVRRAFKRQFGITFLEMARLRRLRESAGVLAKGGKVIEAQLDAGYDSPAAFRTAFAKLLGQAPAKFVEDALLRADWIDTPLGAMIAVSDRHRLHLLEFFDRPALPGSLRHLLAASKGSFGLGRYAPTDQVEAELAKFFAGDDATFRTPLALEGSDFTRTVWDTLCAIPAGQTRSYADIAREIGRPSAVRAVARANGANRIALVVPCHRVIGSDGSLTGYGGGLWRKRTLIELERRYARP